MGQYHKAFNITKREFIDGYEVGVGQKLLEQCGPAHILTTSDAVWLLLANSTGIGDGDDRPHPLIGRWAGDRIVVQGDYAKTTDQAFTETEGFLNIGPQVRAMLCAVFPDRFDEIIQAGAPE